MKFSFQTIIITLFITIFIIAILVFSGLLDPASNNSSNTVGGQVVMWGTVSGSNLQPFINEFNMQSTELALLYVQKNPDTLYQELMMAIANNMSPDLILLTSESFSEYKDKLYVIPYQAYNERLFKDTNIDGAQIFMSSRGIYGFPLLVDPLVVYYNKDILAANNFITPPTTWTSLVQSVPLLTNRTAQHTISQSTIALGEVSNINHFRDILSMLFLQTGNGIVSVNQNNGRITSTLITDSFSTETTPIEQAVSFYTNFSNPTNVTYSWHSNLPESMDYFISGRSAFYIGRASEIFTIRDRNPNLNFDVMQMFQASANARPITYGSFIGVGILNTSRNFNTAYIVAGQLSSVTNVDALSKALSIPPVRRDLLRVVQSDPYVDVFFKSALSSFTWADPSPLKTKEIFKNMILNIKSGRLDVTQAINQAARSF